MLRRNTGPLDRTLRFIVGVALIPIGLVSLGGGQGNLAGIVVTALAALPILTSVKRLLSGVRPVRDLHRRRKSGIPTRRSPDESRKDRIRPWRYLHMTRTRT